MTDQRTELILYATPAGLLGEQIDRYLAESLDRYGANTAHRYPAHCTLTGFFRDDRDSIPGYLSALDTAFREVRRPSELPVTIERLRSDGPWYGLELTSPWLIELTAAFKRHAAPLATDEIRLKTWLHLSLAYGFDPDDADGLASLARELDVAADVTWAVALWERDGTTWTRHGTTAPVE
jgi:ubiquitin-associated SH3 domain-containing protein